MKKYLLSILLALALPALVLAYFQPATLTNGVDRVAVYTKAQADNLFSQGFTLEGAKNALGAVSGYIFPNTVYFQNGSVEGGRVITFTATSTQAAKTMPVDWLRNYSQIDVGATNTVALTLTLPGTSTLFSVLNRVGDTKTMYLRNLNAAATTTTIAAGTGVDLRMGEETGADVIIDGLNNAMLTFKRVSTANAVVLVNEDVVGD